MDNERDRGFQGGMSFLKRRWLYASVGLVVLLCVALGTFLVWHSNQPVKLKTVYVLPEPNPERTEILKRALQPPKSAYATKVFNEAAKDATTDKRLEATGTEPPYQNPQHDDDNIESSLLGIDEKTQTDVPGMQNGKVVDWEKYLLHKENQRGWYKPDDVPIVNSPPQPDGIGVYVWDSETTVAYSNRPPEIEKQDRLLRNAFDAAIQSNDGKRALSIHEQLIELNAPYAQNIVMPVAAIQNIPHSWTPYFDSILTEKYGIQASSNDVQSRALERFYSK